MVRRDKKGWIREIVSTVLSGGNCVTLLCDQKVGLSFVLRLCLILGTN